MNFYFDYYLLLFGAFPFITMQSVCKKEKLIVRMCVAIDKEKKIDRKKLFLYSFGRSFLFLFFHLLVRISFFIFVLFILDYCYYISSMIFTFSFHVPYSQCNIKKHNFSFSFPSKKNASVSYVSLAFWTL